jgi:hypothetical protein
MVLLLRREFIFVMGRNDKMCVLIGLIFFVVGSRQLSGTLYISQNSLLLHDIFGETNEEPAAF